MKRQRKNLRKNSFFRGLALALALTLVVTMCPSLAGSTNAYADTSKLTTEKPVILVTGSAVIGADAYAKANVGYEKAYTLDELKGMLSSGSDSDSVGGEDVLYSSINAYSTKKLNRATGVYVSSLLSGTNVNITKDKVAFVANDDRTVLFDPNAKYSNGNSNTTGLSEPRYAFPGLLTGNLEIKTEVETMLAWELSSDGSDDPGTAKDAQKPLTLVAGQLNGNDQNNPLFNKQLERIVGGEALTEPALTVGTKSYTRGDILLMERADASYTYDSKGGATDNVCGVPLSVLLDGYDESAVVTFGTADNYDCDATGKTVGDLIKDNYMLAYEKDGSAVYDTAQGDSSIYGFFRLYGEGAKPSKFVNSITVKSSSGGQDTPTTPDKPDVPDTPDTPKDYVGDADADTADISFVGNGLVKKGYFTIKGLKSIENRKYKFDWMDKAGNKDTSIVEGAEMKNILKDILGITDGADKIRFTTSDGKVTTMSLTRSLTRSSNAIEMSLDDMFVKDKNKQRPVLAWKVDDEKCDPVLVIGQQDDADVNKSKWIENIVKVEVIDSSKDESDDPVNPDNPDTPDIPDNPSGPDDSNSKTGDDTPIGLYGAALVIAALAAAGVFVFRKREHNEQ